MSKKIAMIVRAVALSRVVLEVEDNFNPNDITDEELDKIIKVAKPRLINNLTEDYEDCFDDAYEDDAMPYDAKYDDVIFSIID